MKIIEEMLGSAIGVNIIGRELIFTLIYLLSDASSVYMTSLFSLKLIQGIHKYTSHILNHISYRSTI